MTCLVGLLLVLCFATWVFVDSKLGAKSIYGAAGSRLSHHPGRVFVHDRHAHRRADGKCEGMNLVSFPIYRFLHF